MWDKVDRRVAPRRKRGWKKLNAAFRPAPHPTSLREATFSHRGEKDGNAENFAAIVYCALHKI
ncbi:hypothetical protein MESS2_100023 [Mesorhizobium metallidurans STM 2683]|uniref:Uncharacterized protein n=1 Tax=Mesorhizobium metallidurans STM 2683 TaxID=1297569 RepID=M5EFM5_9HYPH|nr:hypothetical protein MESS2_100023 [Mesorhizobium metallidurans STM 2683]